MTLTNSHRWNVLRTNHIMLNPLCVFCKKEGRITLAQEVDHIKPHKENLELFLDETNWQSLCLQCHRFRKKQIETNGFDPYGCNDEGYPLDQNHPCNR